MKTALQHFNELPQPYGQMAIEETIRQGQKHLLKHKGIHASRALTETFTWWGSEIGYEFWDGIYNNCEHLESQSKQDKG